MGLGGAVPGRGKLRTGEIRHSRGVPNYAMVLHPSSSRSSGGDRVYPNICDYCIQLYPKLQKCVSHVYPHFQVCVSRVYTNFFFICSPTRSVPSSFVPWGSSQHDEAIILEHYLWSRISQLPLQRMMTPLRAKAPQLQLRRRDRHPRGIPFFIVFMYHMCIPRSQGVSCVYPKSKKCVSPVVVDIHHLHLWSEASFSRCRF